MSEPLDLSAPLRLALLGDAMVCALIGQWKGEPAVHTRRPLPSDTPYPCIGVSPEISVADQDTLRSRFPIVSRDVIAYGQLGAPGASADADDYRAVTDLGFLIRQLFHRRKEAIVVPGFSVVQIVATGPMPAPTDDPKHVARAVLLRITLQDVST